MLPVIVESSQCCSRLHLIPPHITTSGNIPKRYASSSSSTRWQSRQGKDRFVKEAKVQGLKSRAAFKLLAINARHKIFKKGQTVVDLVGHDILRMRRDGLIGPRDMHQDHGHR